MKIRLSLICMVVFLTAMNVADAQLLHHHGGAGLGLRGGNGLATGGQSAFRQVRGDVQAGIPGRFWFETNLADDGLGYNGSYLTLGSKRRLFEDFLDGRWLFEAQLHHSIDEDERDFFTNFGIERVFSIPAAGADVSVGGWYDYNGETQAAFSNPFHQVAISGAIKTRRWDLLSNGYFPIGDTDQSFGDPTGVNPFVRNSLVREAAIDAAQTGFDVTLRMRPRQLAFANGTIDFGGYGYKSDLVDFFGGGRVRLGFQALKGAIVSAEVNHDDRFNTTGLLSIGWIFGANGGVGGEYAGLARDLEPTLRNDHIVRVANEAAFVINPLTGEPYNVLHVNNEGGEDGASGLGTFESPFLTLAEAEAAGVADDAIFVASGDGTSRGLETGLDLKDRQLLLGDGGTYSIPDARNGTMFPLVTDGGTGPIITNPLGTSVVELADGNRIAGVTIDGTGATFGINGDGVTNLVMEDVTVENASQDGVRLSNFSGQLDLRQNTFSNNLGSGLLVENHTDNTSTFLLANNVANFNGVDGFSFQGFDPGTFILNENTTSNNAGTGLVLNDFGNTSGNGLNIINHTADSNIGIGIDVDQGDGKLNILNPIITNNASGGILITDWTNVDGEFTVIGGVDGTLANIVGNGQGPNNLQIDLTQPGLLQNVLITQALIADGNGSGIVTSANGIGTVMNLEIRDNVTVSGHFSNGIVVSALDSAVVNATIGNPDNLLPDVLIEGNGASGASGLELIAQGASGLPPARLDATVTNIQLQNAEDPLLTSVQEFDSQSPGIGIRSLGAALVDVTVTDSNIGAPANTFDTEPLNVSTGIDITLANDGSLDSNGDELINRVFLDNLNIVVGDTDGSGGNSGVGLNIVSGVTTLSDIVLQNSSVVPNNLQTTGAAGDDSVFGDAVGFQGISASYTGTVDEIDLPYLAGPGNVFFGQGGFFNNVESDGVVDSLSSLAIRNNVIRDFTFNGVDIQTSGDAELLLEITGNQIVNNGAGDNADTDGDNIFFEPVPSQPIVTAPGIDTLLFYDGINIDASEVSLISARIVGNLIEDNFEAGLSINTFQRATVNALVEANAFDGNDRGASLGVEVPLTFLDQDRGVFGGSAPFAGSFDIELVNNEEFFFRDFETPVFTVQGGDDNGALFEPIEMILLEDVPMVADNEPGVPIPGNDGSALFGGLDAFGAPVPFGVANLNVVLNNNAIDLAVLAQDFSADDTVTGDPNNAGDFTLGAEGSNAATPVLFPQTPTDRTTVDDLIQNTRDDLQMRGF